MTELTNPTWGRYNVGNDIQQQAKDVDLILKGGGQAFDLDKFGNEGSK